MAPLKGTQLACMLLPEPQRYKDTVRCTVQGAEVPGDCQKQLMQTLSVHLLKRHFLHPSLIVKSQQNMIELVTRPAYLKSNLDLLDQMTHIISFDHPINHANLPTVNIVGNFLWRCLWKNVATKERGYVLSHVLKGFGRLRRSREQVWPQNQFFFSLLIVKKQWFALIGKVLYSFASP